MGAFSDNMRSVATTLITNFGSTCTLTKITKGQYIPSAGKSNEAKEDFKTVSTPAKRVSEQFGALGINTNLAGFTNEKVIVPWFGKTVDETWLYNGHNIISVEETIAQNDIIIFTLEIGES